MSVEHASGTERSFMEVGPQLPEQDSPPFLNADLSRTLATPIAAMNGAAWFKAMYGSALSLTWSPAGSSLSRQFANRPTFGI
jgi:hypothetical protein